MIICYVYTGTFIGFIQKMNNITFLILVPILNFIGLGYRVLIEWGEVTITKELSLFSALMTYIPIITLIYIGYFYSKSYINKVS